MIQEELPDGFRHEIIGQMGAEEGERLLAALDNGEPSVGIRLNPAKPCELPQWAKDAKRVEWSVNGLRLQSRPSFTLTPGLHQGAFYVQEPASMVMESVIAGLVRENGGNRLNLIDLCAAPGGKTTAALSQLPAGSLVVANEFVADRAKVLQENLEKWGAPDVVVTNSSIDFASGMEGWADVVIADVPCSGEGMMRKEAVARRQWSPALVNDCAALQRKILSDAVPALKENGALVYSTCTFNRTENEDNVDWLCFNHGFEVISMRRFMPHITDSEGLFVCVLRKRGHSGTFRLKTAPQKGVPLKDISWLRADALNGGGGLAGLEHNGQLSAISRDLLPVVQWLQQKKVRILGAGVAVAERKAKGMVPLHGIAMCPQLLQLDAVSTVELDSQAALQYLARLTPEVALPGGKGFAMFMFNGLPLGWVKNLGNRYNNLYPVNYRIRTGV